MIPIEDLLVTEDSRVAPVYDEDTGRIHFQGFVYELKEEEAIIADYDWIDTEELVLPSSFTYQEKEYPVTTVGQEAFFYCSEITKLTIPSTIQSLETNAFYGCDELKEIVFEKGLTKIGNAAFYGCDALTEVTLPEGLLHIGSEAFCSCTQLKTVHFPDSVKEIESEAFFGCSAMESITLPESLTSLSEGLFSECESLAEVNLPKNLVLVGNEAFWYCTSLTKLNLPDGLVQMGEKVFYNAGIVELTLPSSINGINQDTFDGCDTIKKLYVEKDDVERYKQIFEETEIEILEKQ